MVELYSFLNADASHTQILAKTFVATTPRCGIFVLSCAATPQKVFAKVMQSKCAIVSSFENDTGNAAFAEAVITKVDYKP